jgi:hypothetical protein
VIGLRSTLGPMFLVMAPLVFGQTGSPGLAKAAADPAACNLASLPSDIQSRLKKDFGSWKIQEPENLSENARKTWAGRRPPACPGIAVGLFQNAKTASYAVLVVPVDHPDAAYRFLVFSHKAGEPSYEPTAIEQFDDHGASNYFIRKVPISDFFGAESKKKFQVAATEAIEMIDSAEQEYGASIYFWSNGHFRQEPVDD